MDWLLYEPQYHFLMAIIALSVLIVVVRINRQLKQLSNRLEAENAKGIAIHALLSKRRAS